MGEPEQSFEDRVRERAYELWVEDGRPSGRADEHWLRAEWLIRAEDEDAAGPQDQ